MHLSEKSLYWLQLSREPQGTIQAGVWGEEREIELRSLLIYGMAGC